MFEGDRQQVFRMLRPMKNRFGSTQELALFAMAGAGLAAVPDPSRLLLAERPELAPGSVVVATVEGSRPLLVEVQALLVRTSGSNPRRVVSGINPNRVALILAVLERHLGFRTAEMDAYFKLTGGVSVEDPALDLGIAAAAVSSLKGRPVMPKWVVMGEVGLTGEVRRIPRTGDRLAEAHSLGFAAAVCPRSGDHPPLALSVHPVQRLGEAMEILDLS